MNTKRVITARDAEHFFNTSINTIDDAIGTATLDLSRSQITFDFNAVLLLRFDGVFADNLYKLNHYYFDDAFKQVLKQIKSNEITDSTEFHYVRQVDNTSYTFDVKLQKETEDIITVIFICFEKLLETENQLTMFGSVVGAGLSMFAGCTWWIDYDKYSDHFYQSDVGPKILGIPIDNQKLYNTRAFQEVRNKARSVSEFYEMSIDYEMKAYEAVRNNETDYFGGRTPCVTANDDIVWVEAYGKCLIRYPDGRPRFFVSLDIYMTDIYEEKTQLELLSTLTNYGLTNSDVGVWYHQRHFLEGKYYFTSSYQKLMSDDHIYKDDTITDILNQQIKLMEQDGRGYEKHLHEFRKVHNSIYIDHVDKYHIVIPNYKNKNLFQWIEVRGTVIERDDQGNVLLFVGVNVDVTESYLRNQELERLRLQNERLQLAERLAVRARNLMVWYHEIVDSKRTYLFGNELFTKLLGVKRDDQGLIKFSDINRSLVTDTIEAKLQAKHLIKSINDIYRLKINSFKRILAKHKNLQTGEILYLEHSVEVSELYEDGSIKLLGGILLNVTENVLYQRQIRYLADYDTLTDVFNRNYFEKYISEKLPSSYSILVFDLDGLKLINDVFGHLDGDRIIKRLAKYLKQVFNNSLFIARIGGDEFAVLTSEIDFDKVTAKANELERVIEEFNQNSPIEMNVSKGGKVVINNDIPFDKAFVQAENIMYRRKLNNRSSRKSKVLESILETLNAKTEETLEHSERVSQYAVETMRELGLTRSSEIEDVQLLARVHDIGKITVDDKILKKPGLLDKDEYELVKKHSEAGYKIIRNITDSDNVCNGVLFHHERYDGKGYPQGLQGDEIPIFARIISVVDSYDAMTSDRIYREKMTQDEAIAELLKNSGTQFDPKVVKAFIKGSLKIDLEQRSTK